MPILTSNTICRQTADTLLAASTFLEVMSVWKNNDPEITSKTKFAKYHALRIVKAIKANEDPNATNPRQEAPQQAMSPSALDPNDPEVRSINQGAPPENPYQPYVETVPNTTQPSPSLSARQVSPPAPNLLPRPRATTNHRTTMSRPCHNQQPRGRAPSSQSAADTFQRPTLLPSHQKRQRPGYLPRPWTSTL